MKAYLRELIPDLKAAARIGHPQSLQAALDGLRALPEVKGNSKMQPAFVESVIAPAGLALSARSLRLKLLEELLQDPLAGVRAASAAALGVRFAAGEDVPEAVLSKAGSDAREEVRFALAHGISRSTVEHERISSLLHTWLGDRSPRLQESALLALLALPFDLASELFSGLCALDPGLSEEVDKALMAALGSLAERGAAEDVLVCLESWARKDAPPLWVITRTMMRSWARAYRQKAMEILDILQARLGPMKEISSCRNFLDDKNAAEG